MQRICNDLIKEIQAGRVKGNTMDLFKKKYEAETGRLLIKTEIVKFKADVVAHTVCDIKRDDGNFNFQMLRQG